ncbi:mandelate racemase/muconate lactonizing enzyme family protein [Micromonospora sp. NPDC048871]|uniref:mandelate racemase/muconate lactonizing enzyme family protein n=1 Tax=unclassified Micromonospora TaxID=2617518 RepID=UPI002E0E3DCB|nr:mandelate racemase/muconate lactonizing enzyme family protein [Micromonospora sp. NBC_01739]
MRITGYRTLTTVQEWGRPVGDANGVFADGVVPVPIVVVDTDLGISGVGIGPHVEIERIFAAIDGEDPRAVTTLYDRMLRHTFKAGHAGPVFGTIGSLDTALWDIKAQIAGEPLWRLLGGRDRRVPAYASGLDIALSDDELVATYQGYARHGLRAAKLKGGLDIERDRHRLELVGEVLTETGHGRRPGLMLDVNEAWTRKQAVRHVCELERTLDLIWIEEPVRRWDAEGLATVGRGVRASIATGENLTGFEQYPPLIAAGAVDIVQTAAVGGITHFLRVAALAHAHDLPVSPIGNSLVGLLHAATSVPNHLTSELQDLSAPVGITFDLQVEGGAFVLGDSPGLGVRLDEQRISAADRRPPPPASEGPHVRPERAGRRLLAEADGVPPTRRWPVAAPTPASPNSHGPDGQIHRTVAS